MINILQNNELIYSFLEEKSQLPLAFDFSQVIGFDDEDDFCLYAYNSDNRNFILFKAENYVQNKDILVDLIESVQEFSSNVFPIDLQQVAIKLIEDKLHSKNNSRFFFDAH